MFFRFTHNINNNIIEVLKIRINHKIIINKVEKSLTFKECSIKYLQFELIKIQFKCYTHKLK